MKNNYTSYFKPNTLIFIILMALQSFGQTNYIIKKGLYHELPREKLLVNLLHKLPQYNELRNQYSFIKNIEKEMTTESLSYTCYIPNDNYSKHPLIIYMGGGSLMYQKENTRSTQLLGEYFANNGVAFMSIEYRTQALSLLSLSNAGFLAVQDAKISIKYAKSIAQELKVSTEHIYIGGYSAGAVVALTSAALQSDEIEFVEFAMLDEKFGCLDCEGPSGYNSSVKGVINISGAVTNLEILKDEKFPILQFVGVDDRVIPSVKGLPFQDYLTKPMPEKGFLEIIKGFFNTKLKIWFSQLIARFMDIPKVYGALSIERSYNKNETHSYPFHDHRLLISKNGRKMEHFDEICRKILVFTKQDIQPATANYNPPTNLRSGEELTLDPPIGHRSYRWYMDDHLLSETESGKYKIKFNEEKSIKLGLAVQNDFGEWSDISVQEIKILPALTLSEKLEPHLRNPWLWIFSILTVLGIIYAMKPKKGWKTVFMAIIILFITLPSDAQNRRPFAKLKGNIHQQVIFINNGWGEWTKDEIDTHLAYVKKSHQWLERKAHSYGKELTITYSATNSVYHDRVIAYQKPFSFSELKGTHTLKTLNIGVRTSNIRIKAA